MAQSNPSVPIPLHINCQAFVILFWESCKCPMEGLSIHTNALGLKRLSIHTNALGLKNRVQMHHHGTMNTQTAFPVNIKAANTIFNYEMIKMHEVPYTNCPKPLVIITVKKITSI